MTYRLSSIDLNTQFDDPVKPLVVPAVAEHGDSLALCMLDGANRAPYRLARLVRRVAMLGLRLENPGTGVRVTIRFLVDENATTMWRHAHLDDVGDPVLEDEFGKHRLLEVSAQGRTRAAILLRREPDEPAARGHVQFDLPAEEIDGSGIVMIGFESPGAIPAWAEQDLLEDAAIGVCIRSVGFEPLGPEPVAGDISGGKQAHRATLVKAKPGFFVVNPGTAPGPVNLVLWPRLREPREVAGGRRARLVEPLHRVRNLGERVADRRLTRGTVQVEAISLTGRKVQPISVEPGEGDRYVVRLPELAEPTFVRARVATGGARAPRAIDWLVRLKRRPASQD